MGSEDFGIKSNPEHQNYFDMAVSSPQYLIQIIAMNLLNLVMFNNASGGVS